MKNLLVKEGRGWLDGRVVDLYGRSWKGAVASSATSQRFQANHGGRP